MGTYRRTWMVATGAVLGLGVATGLSTLTVAAGVALVLPLAGLGALYGFLWSPFLPGVRHPCTAGALLGTSAGPALIGLFTTLGPPAALLLGGLALTHPAALSRLVGRRPAPPAPSTAPDTATASAEHRAPARQAPRGRVDLAGTDRETLRTTLRTAGDADLRQAWITTNESLGFSRPADRAVALAEVRALLLDEFERRDPASFRAWLWAAPRPSSGPELRPRRHPGR